MVRLFGSAFAPGPGARRPYLRHRPGLGAVAVGLSWVLLWLVWPMGAPAVRGLRRPAVTRVAYEPASGAGRFQLLPDQFARPWMFAAGARERTEGLASDVPELPARPVERLARGPEDAAGGLGAAADTLPAAARRARAPFVAGLEPPAAFAADAAAAAPPRVAVEASRGLASRGLRLPPFEADAAAAEKPWMVTAYVQLAADGSVDHVLVESGGEDPAVTARVVRHLYRGAADPGADGAAGRVVVSGGRR